MTAQLAPLGVQKFFDNNGQPLAFGFVFTYQAGTTTPQATYVDSTQTTPNPNPVPLNARGECPLWLDPTLGYKINLVDQAGNQIPGWPVDNIPGGFGALPISVSLIPTPTNTYTLGNSTHSWAQLYLGVNASPALDTASGIVGYYPRTAAEISAGITPASYAYSPGPPYIILERYGTNQTALLSACLVAAQLTIVGNQTITITIDVSVSISSNITIPYYVNLKFVNSGQLAIASGVTVTYNGFVEAGRQTIFALTGTGVATFTGSYQRTVRPEWWGAVGQTGTDDTNALRAALMQASNMSGVMQLTALYNHNSTISFPANVECIGVGFNLATGFRPNGAVFINFGVGCFRSKIKSAAIYADACTNGQTVIFNDAGGNCYNNMLEDVTIFGLNTNSANVQGVLAQTCQDIVLRRLRVDCAGVTAGTKGIYATAGTISLLIEDVDVEACYDAVYIDATAQVTITNPYIERHLNTGIRLTGTGSCTVFAGKILNPSGSQNAIQLDTPQNVSIFGTDVGSTGGGVVANGGASPYVNVNISGVPSGRINDPNNFLQIMGSGIFSGTVTLSAATSAAVTFGTPPLNNNKYQVSLSQSATSISPPWVTSKATSGFAINFSAAYTGSVDWSVRL